VAVQVLVVGEIIKLTLVEQVIEITKPKLMSFRWFAWAYGHWEAVMDRLRSIEAWQAVRRQFHINRRTGAADQYRPDGSLHWLRGSVPS
jgi:hypothetical protein